MTKRTLKSFAKPKDRKVKTRKSAGPGTSYERNTAATQNAVRDESLVRYEATSIGDAPLPRSVPATQAKNRFGEILQAARNSGPVFIERHGHAQAVVLGIETYNKLTSNERTSQERKLDYWTREFNALHARMQTREARQAVDALFSATDDQLNGRDR